MSLVEMSDFPNSHARDFLGPPVLSLSLAGIFGAAEGGSSVVQKPEEAVEISSENSVPGKSRSDDDNEGEQHSVGDAEEDDENNGNKLKKRKKYHRHTPEQIREMEALFKESPHPDEKQRLQLSKQLGLHPRQVKFWFQNRRTQIKAIQERHENTILKTEIDKLRDENKALSDIIKKQSCPNCGFGVSSKDAIVAADEPKLRVENARLRAEVEKLRTIIGNYSHGTSPNSSSYPENEQENKSSLDLYTRKFCLDKSRIMDAVHNAMDELRRIATHGEPLWLQSYETGRQMLNYDEYMKEFCSGNFSSLHSKKCIEASRESGIVFADLPWLVKSFMDVNQWKELFPCLVSRAATVDVICKGEIPNGDGVVLLVFAEIQMLTPLVPAREVYFVRYCKQSGANQWAIADVSIDEVEDSIDAALQKCRKRPSGCIIEDVSNSQCKVTWVEHLECQKSSVHSLYRTMVNSGLAFGAKHWISTLQQQCERLVFLAATNVPSTKDSNGKCSAVFNTTPQICATYDEENYLRKPGIAALTGRKSILKLAQRMTQSFCQAVGASSYNSWNKIASKTGEDMRIASRKNINDPGEPIGTILSVVSSVWLPVSHHILFNFLRDENRRNEWDVMFNGSTIETVANMAKGQDRGNAVTVLNMKVKEHNTWLLQDGCTNAFEAMVVYAPVDIKGMQSMMTGCDSSNIAVLASGFSILPDRVESRPFLITSQPEENIMGGSSLLTTAFQILVSNSPTGTLSADSVDSVSCLILRTLQNIKRSLQCEE